LAGSVASGKQFKLARNTHHQGVAPRNHVGEIRLVAEECAFEDEGNAGRQKLSGDRKLAPQTQRARLTGAAAQVVHQCFPH
jgi:hypothetical protein